MNDTPTTSIVVWRTDYFNTPETIPVGWVQRRLVPGQEWMGERWFAIPRGFCVTLEESHFMNLGDAVAAIEHAYDANPEAVREIQYLSECGK